MKRKHRVLIAGDKSIGNTGFATYKKELLKGLYNKFDVAEFAFCGTMEEKKRVKWRYYPCITRQGEPDHDMFMKNPHENKNGKWRWEAALLHFQPDVVISVQDPWQVAYQAYSMLREYYSYCTAAPVDSHPQRDRYLQIYNAADVVVPYTEYAKNVLQNAGLKNITDPVPMGVDTDVFKRCKREKARDSLRIPKDAIVFGMVARNQPRKRFPELIRAFAKYLEEAPPEKAEKSYLYLHTTYMDQMSWDIVRSLLENKVLDKTLFTYVCMKTGKCFASKFREKLTYSPFSHEVTGRFLELGNAPPTETLSDIYNSMDLYIQFANAEGFGVPLIEAASCQIPIVSVNYAAHGEVAAKVGGDLLEPLSLEEDYQVRSRRAVMPIDDMVQYMVNFSPVKNREKLDSRNRVLSNYTWKICCDGWEKIIKGCPLKEWNNPQKRTFDEIQFGGKMSPTELISKAASGLPWKYTERVLEDYKNFMHGAANGRANHEAVLNHYNQIYSNFTRLEEVRSGEKQMNEMEWMK